MEKLILIGVAIVFIGIILILIGSIFGATSKNVESAGGVFIGPFPILGFASSRKMFYFLIVLMIVIFIISLIIRKFT